MTDKIREKYWLHICQERPEGIVCTSNYDGSDCQFMPAQIVGEMNRNIKTIEAQAKEIKRLEKEFKNRGGKLAQMTYLVKLKYGNKDERIWELICETEKELGLTK